MRLRVRSPCSRRNRGLESRRMQVVPDGAIGVEPLVAGAFRRPWGRWSANIRSGRGGAGQFHRLVLGFRRQRDDQIEGTVLQIVEAAGRCLPSSMPISSITSTAKGSSSPARTPADST